MRSLVILVLLIAAGVGGWYAWNSYANSTPDVVYRTVPVRRGELLATITATGTVEPEEVVDVGAQVVGRINKLGDDLRSGTDPKFAGKSVDYGSPVEEGMVLAEIDPSVYQAQFDQAQASLDRAKADLLQLEARLAQSDAEWKRAQKLRSIEVTGGSPTGSNLATASGLPIRGITDADFILAKANYDIAAANIVVGKASIAQQNSTLELARTNLSYTVIRSPVNGTIIDRRVNIGQTVVSSLNAPSLFLIARDLRRMQVWASVNEADIGPLKPGIPVHFTVDAFPKDIFRGTVEQVRLNASMTQNVVTYTVVISADNANLKLLPYLTANVKFEIDKRTDALMVPNAALRYMPPPEQVDKSLNSQDNKEKESASEKKSSDNDSTGTVWVQASSNGLLRPIVVQIGLSDGAFTEIISGDLEEGMEVVLGEMKEVTDTETINNPLAPPRFRGTRPR